MRSLFKPKGSCKTTGVTREQFDYILDEFEDRHDYRMQIISHLMYRCIRIGDILNTLKIQNIYAESGEIGDRIVFNEQKTGKLRIINNRGRRFLKSLQRHRSQISHLPTNAPLFYTQKTGQPLKDSGVKMILRQFVGKRGIRQCSPHSFRKGGARYMYDNGVRIENICDVLNHHSTRTTEIYIEITPKDIEESMKCLEI
jgi:site-specific recombinase XerD